MGKSLVREKAPPAPPAPSPASEPSGPIGADDERVPDFRMEGVGYSQVALQPPFAVVPPLGDDWRLYIVRGGEVVFEASDLAQTRLTLPPGSVVALSGVVRHKFSSPGAEVQDRATADWVESPLRTPDDGAITLAIGRIAQAQMMFLVVFERILIISSAVHPQTSGRIGSAVGFIAEEASRPGPEAIAIVRRLSEIIALEIGRFRRSVSGVDERLARQAVSDVRIMRAISAFYAAPQERWSLERLAEVAGMSRTAFAVHYRTVIGTTPVKSLRQLRMQLAAGLLSTPLGDTLLESTAMQVGYGSSAAFIRAFSKEFGKTPGSVAAVRKTQKR